MIVTFLPQNIKQPAELGERLFEVAAKANIMIDGSCGGKGTCGKCKVQVIGGKMPPLDAAEEAVLTKSEINDGYRLACHLIVEGDLGIVVPQKHQDVSRKLKATFMPENLKYTGYIIKHFIELVPATIENQQGDVERIISSLKNDDYWINPKLIPNIPEILNQSEKITVVIRDTEIMALEAGDTTSCCHGIAFDIGTTTVVGMLWDLNKSELIGVSAVANPQSIFGADVISRITYCSEDQSNLATMKDKIIDCFNKIIESFENDYGVKSDEIYEACVVGNTTMSHLFLGVNPEQLARAPFAPVFCGSVNVVASEMKLKMNQLANIHLMPNIAGHVGSDIISGLLATGITEEEGLQLFIDVGTNGEIVLSQNGRILTCSTAAGPAFEGAAIYQGMRAATGAIESVKIEKGEVTLKTIEDQEPIGICGSGLIDAISQMLSEGLIDYTGKLLDEKSALEKKYPKDMASRLRSGTNGKEFVLAWREKSEDMVLTQKDIRQVQLAKGAILSGIIILLNKMEANAEDITKITIAGAFGNNINKESALRIGLFPNIEIDRISSVGNAAGVGASMALLSIEERKKAQLQARKIEHIELATYGDFQTEYIKAMNFPNILIGVEL